MVLLSTGVGLWWAGHFFKRTLPNLRNGLGNAGKGVSALIIAAGLGLMIWGYRSAEFVPVWWPPTWAVHLNNLMMFAAIALFGMGSSKGTARSWLRHPMLTGALVFGLAHLLVNGDLASIILFGGIAGWVILQMIVINLAEPEWVRPKPGPVSGDIRLLIISAVLFAVITALHSWLGPWPFPL
ncbi:MAG: NnrU family protein [Pseudomonadota bacterium]